MKLVLFCEGPSDHRTVTGFVDRLLHEHGRQWMVELLTDQPEAVRAWIPDSKGRPFFDLHAVDSYVKEHKIRVQYGHFDGKPGSAGAQMARNVFHLVRAMNKRAPSEEAITGVVLVWDMDDQGDERRFGLQQARAEAQRWAPFSIVLGCPDRMREAWVLAGFEPESDEEKSALYDERKQIGFSPVDEAHALDAKDESAKRSPKRVLRRLTGGDHDREARSWTHTPLHLLRSRGEKSGLCAFLDEVEHMVQRAAARNPL